jgi:Tfp pilus assembly pilus retraction ATPase PilT
MIYDTFMGDQRRRLENDWELDFSYTLPRMGRFRVNRYSTAAPWGGVLANPARRGKELE